MGKTKNIKNLIFDVGNVLIEYNREWMVEELGYEKEYADKVTDTVFGSNKWEDLDAGKITLAEFLEDCRGKCPELYEGIERFMLDSTPMCISRPEVYERIRKLKTKGYKCYLLSNYPKEMFHQHTQGLPFWYDVDGTVVSYEVLCAKPERKIYEILLERYSLDPSECLFFDDRLENVEAAGIVGIDAVQVKSREQLGEMLDGLLLKQEYTTNG